MRTVYHDIYVLVMIVLASEGWTVWPQRGRRVDTIQKSDIYVV